MPERVGYLTKKIVIVLMLTVMLSGALGPQLLEARLARRVGNRRLTDDRLPRVSVLIGFRNTIDAELITKMGGIVTHEFRTIKGLAARVPEAVIPALRRNPRIEFVEPDRLVHVSSCSGETLPWGIEKVNADDVWDTNGDLEVDPGAVAGSGINVAVIDTGIDYTHPDLSTRYGGGYDFVNDDDDPMDDHGHGTHVSGTIAATDNDLGVIGVAPHATIYALKALNATGWGTTTNILRSILWAIDNGMDIVSMSLGSSTPSLLEKRVCDAAYAAGILLVAATGNEGRWRSSYPAGYSSVIGVGAIDVDDTLADFSNKGFRVELVAPGVNVNSTVPVGTGPIAKVITDKTELQANIMEYSPETPSYGITSQVLFAGLGYPTDFEGQDFAGKLALIERGEISFAEKVANAYAAGAAGAIIYNNEPGNFYGSLGSLGDIPAVSLSQEDGLYLRSVVETGPTTAILIAYYGADYALAEGTSMSTPHVSGVAALVKAANTSLSNVEIREILRSAATDLGREGRDPVYGYGLVDAYAAVDAASNVLSDRSQSTKLEQEARVLGSFVEHQRFGILLNRLLSIDSGQ